MRLFVYLGCKTERDMLIMEDKKDVIIAPFAWSDTLTHICNSRCILGIILTQRVLIYVSSVSTFLKPDLWASVSRIDFSTFPRMTFSSLQRMAVNLLNSEREKEVVEWCRSLLFAVMRRWVVSLLLYISSSCSWLLHLENFLFAFKLFKGLAHGCVHLILPLAAVNNSTIRNIKQQRRIYIRLYFKNCMLLASELDPV